MSTPTMTLELARACALDAGNRNMTHACRVSWNSDDWKAACDELDRLWPDQTAIEYEVMP